MEPRLTPQQRAAIDAHPGQPLSLVDEISEERFILLPELAYLHLQGLATETEGECQDQLRRLIQEGIESAEVPAAEAFARLRATAERLALQKP